MINLFFLFVTIVSSLKAEDYMPVDEVGDYYVFDYVFPAVFVLILVGLLAFVVFSFRMQMRALNQAQNAVSKQDDAISKQEHAISNQEDVIKRYEYSISLQEKGVELAAENRDYLKQLVAEQKKTNELLNRLLDRDSG